MITYLHLFHFYLTSIHHDYRKAMQNQFSSVSGPALLKKDQTTRIFK